MQYYYKNRLYSNFSSCLTDVIYSKKRKKLLFSGLRPNTEYMLHLVVMSLLFPLICNCLSVFLCLL